ncbi:helix-turn-helix domain-containing protein [Clostridium tetani]|uniref:Phage-related protein n=1 Tax=Clostridium tetani (strain Massachusetts / E88) TaxID=212717 RepID=Q894H8_CLOTE|nr:helix-turn-helix domain-containing protein [Clostridium tetani]AAO36114.1 phage-related protein [Clostridium tetani E88]RXI62085.1 helix-turn-helix domain-containing protein [Clostridium tetani]RXI64129.1 helix-turn-helix domain-containing protein [Clostridium tetani]RXI65781.1 helix-turn-helix domain-containing protein [Clostridium tetani]RXI71663.1 helix-turn-helix domain-containing protein [Clostridium tetani]
MAKKRFWEHTKTYIKDIFLRKILQANLSPQATKLLLILMGHKNSNTGLCNPSQALLSKEMNRSVRSIQRYLQELVQAGIIAIERIGKMITNKYFLLVDKELEEFKEQYADAKETTNNIKNKCKSYANNYKDSKKKDSWNYEGQRDASYYTDLAKRLLGHV